MAALTAIAARPVGQSVWTIGADAAQLANPLGNTPSVIGRGRAIFASRCRHCHGPDGRGNGPASDPEHPAADLTSAGVGGGDSDGVLFYKVWNGRRPMPAFRNEVTRDDAWAVVAYVKTLRKHDADTRSQ
jgi:mono/diheme cytochrome c family protein